MGSKMTPLCNSIALCAPLARATSHGGRCPPGASPPLPPRASWDAVVMGRRLHHLVHSIGFWLTFTWALRSRALRPHHEPMHGAYVSLRLPTVDPFWLPSTCASLVAFLVGGTRSVVEKRLHHTAWRFGRAERPPLTACVRRPRPPGSSSSCAGTPPRSRRPRPSARGVSRFPP